MPSVQEIPGFVADLQGLAREEFERVYNVDRLDGGLDVPESFRAKVAKWCGGSDAPSEAWRCVENQFVVSIFNRWTYESALFNPLRANRPSTGPENRITPDEIAQDCFGAEKCDFCDVERLTSSDPFGRVRGNRCVTAGNTFKSAGLHGLIIWSQHAPHKLTSEDLADSFKVADEWFIRGRAWDKSNGMGKIHHPVFFWNIFRSGGASQIHPHIQLQLHARRLGQSAQFFEQSRAYRTSFPGDELLHAVAKAHKHLGLAISAEILSEHSKFISACWVSLTPRAGGGEIVALGVPGKANEHPRLDGFGPVVSAMLNALRRCGAEGMCVSGFPVPVGKEEEVWVVRIINRGTAAAGISDLGGLEAMGVAGAWTDPYSVIAALRQEVEGIPITN